MPVNLAYDADNPFPPGRATRNAELPHQESVGHGSPVNCGHEKLPAHIISQGVCPLAAPASSFDRSCRAMTDESGAKHLKDYLKCHAGGQTVSVVGFSFKPSAPVPHRPKPKPGRQSRRDLPDYSHSVNSLPIGLEV
jgi:hypothetical protein